MKRRRRGAHRKLSAKTITIPIPNLDETPAVLLESKLGRAGAERAMAKASEELGIPADIPAEVRAAIVLTLLGFDLGKAAGSLAWKEFEDYCAMAMSAAGFLVRRNVRLLKPTRQIDIVASSPSLVLSVDCKHWRRSAGPSSLEALASAQVERTRNYAKSHGPAGTAFLPVLLTLADSRARLIAGVPVVSIVSLKSFLAAVSPFEEGFAYIRS